MKKPYQIEAQRAVKQLEAMATDASILMLSSDKQGNNRDEFVAVVGLNVWNVV